MIELTSFSEALERNRAERPDRLALVDPATAFTWEQLAADAETVGRTLAGWGGGCGGTVVVALPSSSRWVLVFLACRAAGLTVASAGAPRSEAALRDLCLETGAVGIIGDGGAAETPLRVAARLGIRHLDLSGVGNTPRPGRGRVDDGRGVGAPAALHLTSGSTGHRKSVPRSEASLVNEGRAIAEPLAAIEGPMTIVSPVFHSFGAGLLAAALVAARPALLIPRFRLSDVLDSVSAHRAAVLAGVPYVFQCLTQVSLSSRFDTSSLRLGLAGGTTLHEDLVKRFRERFGATLAQEYGLSEVGVVSLNLDDPEGRPWSVGRPLPGLELTAEASGGSREGELLVRFAPDRDPDAKATETVRTGDLGCVDDAGFVRVTGRLKHLVNVGGVKVAPHEVERRILAGGEFEDVAVVAIPDDLLGERVAAAVVPRPGASLAPEDFHSRYRRALDVHEVPRRVLWLEALPRLESGKPDLQAIRRRLASEEVRKGATVPAD